MKRWKRSVLAIVLSLALCVSSYGAAGADDAISAVSGKSGASGTSAGSIEAEPAVVDGSLLVTFTSTATEKKMEAAADKVDGELVQTADEELDVAVIEIDEEENAEKAMKKLERLPQVEAVQPNFIYYADEDGSEGEEDEDAEDPGSSGGAAVSEYPLWHIEYMRVQEAWDLIDRIRPVSERTAEDKVKVAILDTGVWDHVDLQENLDRENCVTVIASEQPGYGQEPEDSENGSTDGDGTVAEGSSPGDGAGSASGDGTAADGTEAGGTGSDADPGSTGESEDPDIPETPDTPEEPEEPLPPWMADDLEFARYEEPAGKHGTSIAGIIAATSWNGLGTAGVAAGNHNDLIELMGIKVFRDGGYNGQGSATTIDIVTGLRYACQKEAKVINMCLGHAPGAEDGMGGYHDDALLKSEIDRAVREDDVVIVSSAGNKKDTRTWYPADFKNVVGVINSQQYSDVWSLDVKSPSSSYGSKKDVSAPGSKIYTAKNTDGYKRGSGTSCASANAAGVAALVRYANPDLAASQVKEILYDTATDLYKDGFDSYTGHGNLNAYKAVAAAAGVELAEEREVLAGGTEMTDTRSVGKNDIEVSWKTDEAAAGYYLYRATSKNGKYELIDHIPDRSTTTYIDEGVRNNRTYYYSIATLGTSQTTKEKIWGEMCQPITGKAVTEIPDFGISRANSHSLRISWDKAEGAHGYRIFRSTKKNGTYSKVKTIEGGKASGWIDENCTPGKKYHYKVRAYRNVDDDRVWGELSGREEKVAKPVNVADLNVAKKGKKGKKARLTWKKDATVDGYEIYRSVSNSGTWKRIKTIKKNTTGSYTTAKLKKNRVYSYKMRAYVIVKGEKVYGGYSPTKSYIR